MLPETHSAQSGLGVLQEYVLEVLVCQHEHLQPLAGAGLHPTPEAGTSWHLQSRLIAVEWQAPWSSCIHLCIISRSPVSVQMIFERCECRFASLQADNLLLLEAKVEIGTA